MFSIAHLVSLQSPIDDSRINYIKDNFLRPNSDDFMTDFTPNPLNDYSDWRQNLHK